METFEREGIKPSPLADKLWRASVIQGHRNPFGKPLSEYTTPELDFVLEMAAKDDPERYVFVRAGKSETETPVKSRAAWATILDGRLHRAYRAATGSARADQGIARWYAKRQRGLKPGLTRGGKKIEDAGHSTDG